MQLPILVGLLFIAIFYSVKCNGLSEYSVRNREASIQLGNIRQKHKGHHGKIEKLGKKGRKWQTLLLPQIVLETHFIVCLADNGGFNKRANQKVGN